MFVHLFSVCVFGHACVFTYASASECVSFNIHRFSWKQQNRICGVRSSTSPVRDLKRDPVFAAARTQMQKKKSKLRRERCLTFLHRWSCQEMLGPSVCQAQRARRSRLEPALLCTRLGEAGLCANISLTRVLPRIIQQIPQTKKKPTTRESSALSVPQLPR